MTKRIDGDRLEQIRAHFRDKAEHEIFMAEQEGVELKEDDVTAINSKYSFEAEQRIKQVRELGPKQLHKMEMLFEQNGWRTGNTTSSIVKRVTKRRKNKKAGHKSRMKNKK